MNSEDNYHGIILDISQKDASVVRSLDVIGRKKALLGIVIILKVRVKNTELEETIQRLQGNMRRHLFPFVHAFYFHFYNERELIVVFKDKIIRTSTDTKYFTEIIEYGRKK